MKKMPVKIIAALCIMIFSVSCSVGDSNTNPDQGYYLVANISPDSKPLNVYVNNSLLGTGLAYGMNSAYYSVTAGSYTFSFTDSLNNAVLSSTVNLSAKKLYSFFVIDSFHEVRSSFVEDTYTTPSPDSVYIRFFNFSPNSVPVSLSDSATDTEFYTNRTFNDQAGNLGYASYIRIPKGSYTFRVKNISDSVLISTVDSLIGGGVYTLFAKGFYGGTGTQAFSLGQIRHQ